ncbi:MAG: NCS2 family permease [Oscillospiraceae bacterium]|nr:NCS2 family permease [Oscillospiraceae bacterium]
MKNLFKLKEQGSSLSIEIRAGLTTFFAMAYIIFVNPVFLSVTGMDADGALIATCLGAAIGCLLTAVLSNKPFAMASGMGMNAFFAYTLCFGYGYTWQQALALVFISGLLFVVAVLAFGEKAAKLIPANLKHAITVGIGLLIMLIGLFDAGLIDVSAGVPALADLSSPGVLIALAGLLITIVLTVLHIPGGLILGMLATVLISLLCGQSQLPEHAVMLPTALGKVFLKLDFHGLALGDGGLSSVVSLLALILTMTIVDMFDTIGYLVGTGSRAGLVDEKGNMTGMRRVMLADAGATVLGSLCGTSTVTVYAESTSGIVAGGRTGLTGLVTGVCFLLALFLSPLAGMMNAAVTAPALIVVGMYLMLDITKLELKDLADAIPALLTIVFIPMTYSITAGIGIGFLSYVVCALCRRRWKDLTPGVILLAVVFLLYFVLS